MGVYEDLEKFSHKVSNGSLEIVFKDSEGNCTTITQLTWEDITDIEHALNLEYTVNVSKLVTLNTPKVWWADNLKFCGENLENCKKKFEFLMSHFVGSFNY